MARQNDQRQTDRRQEMREWFHRREQEGWTLRELARRSGIPAGTVSWWSHELRKRRGRKGTKKRGFYEVVPTAPEASVPPPPGPESAIRIRLRDGTELDLVGGVDERVLARVLAVLTPRC